MKIRLFLFVVLAISSTSIILLACNKENVNAAATSPSGKGGSLTRFTVSGNYLYAVENHFLYAYSLIDAMKPKLVFKSDLNYDIETIYPYNNNLYLGTRTGLYIYSIDTPEHPRLIGEAQHARSCDPVVVNDTVAYVTLKSSSSCGPATSGLYIHDIKNIQQPVLKKIVELPDPVGLGLQDSILYVCCGSAGLKVFNVKSPFSPILNSTLSDGYYVDVIPYNNTLICFVTEGLILYDITDPAAPKMIKKIAN